MFGSLGMSEILIIFVIALILFGPRKLPELGKSIGEALGHFKRASEDFKRSWETEVEVEKRRIRDVEPPAHATIARSERPEPGEVIDATPSMPSVEEIAAPEGEKVTDSVV